jgi:tRNA-dihydrouridine synthase B
LLQNEPLVKTLLEAVVNAVDVPVTLKIRTGWDRHNRNAVNIAKIAEASGIQALAIHGRTRACAYMGDAEYDTIAEVKANVSIPIIANGDITTPEKARHVLEYAKVDAVMIGRAAQGRPWLFREIEHFLHTGEHLPPPAVTEIHQVLVGHVQELYNFYGELSGLRIARKHISWYTKGLVGSAAFRHQMNKLDTPDAQMAAVNEFFIEQAQRGVHLHYVEGLAA